MNKTVELPPLEDDMSADVTFYVLMYNEFKRGQEYIKTFSPKFYDKSDAVELLKLARTNLSDADKLYISRCTAEYTKSNPDDMRIREELLKTMH